MKIVHVAALLMCASLVPLPCDAQTGKGLSPTDVSKINEVTQSFLKAALAKDWATAAALYVDDAVLGPPNEPAVKGRVAIRKWMERLPPISEFKATIVQVEGRADLAYVWGTYTTTIAAPGVPGPIKDSGKYVEVWRRQADGRWLIAVDMFSSDLPAAPVSPSK